MNLREQFERETDTPAYIHGQLYPHFNSDYVKWLEQRNKEQVEVLRDAYFEIKGLVDGWGIRKEHHPQITILRDLKEQLKKSGELKYISELPEPYRSLAEKRRDYENDYKVDKLSSAFFGASTPEGWGFWYAVDMAKNKQELPPIPEAE